MTNSSETWKSYNLDDWIINQCVALGMLKPTPIQQYCIPQILNGRDCIGCAKTGSGKTMAFAIPILQKLYEDPYGIFAIVLTPTRELAFQIAEQFQVIATVMNIKIASIIGGMDMVIQGQQLSATPHIIVATPGRLVDHLKTCNTFSLQRVKFLVIDEADRLLGGHFDKQLEIILKSLPKKRQTLLFSATVTDTLERLKALVDTNIFCWIENSPVATVEQLDQRYILCPADVKDGYFIHLVEQFYAKCKGSMMIFTGTCRSCQILSMMLEKLGFPCVSLHSMITQKKRLAALAKFKSHHISTMVATDVASRGLDIPAVNLVINYNVPKNAKDYLHRVGRTARAGNNGQSITFVTQNDVSLIHAIESLINTKWSLHSTNEKEILRILTQVAVTRSECEIELDQQMFGEKRLINKKKKLFLEDKNPSNFEAKKNKNY